MKYFVNYWYIMKFWDCFNLWSWLSYHCNVFVKTIATCSGDYCGSNTYVSKARDARVKSDVDIFTHTHYNLIIYSGKTSNYRRILIFRDFMLGSKCLPRGPRLIECIKEPSCHCNVIKFSLLFRNKATKTLSTDWHCETLLYLQ